MNHDTRFSRMMLGTVQFGIPYGIANTRGMPSDEEIAAILKEAFDAGVTSLDTSADYGTSEQRIGDASARLGLSGRFRIVTKIPRIPDDRTDKSEIGSFIEEHLTRSLRRLRSERLAAVLFHVESDAVHLPLLESIIGRGYAEAAGVSLDSRDYPPEVRRARCVQIPANLLDHRFDHLVETVPDANRVVFARSAFLQGLLLMPKEKIPVGLSEIVVHRDRLEALARQAGRTLPEIALGYLYSQPNITSVVVGVDTLDQFRTNLLAAKAAALPEDLMKRLKNTVETLPEELIRPKCWKIEAP